MLRILPLILFLGFWELLSISPKMKFLFGSPLLVGESFLDGILTGRLLLHSGVTAIEAFSGFLIGTFTGTLLGFVLWYSPAIAKICRPYLFVVGAVPVFALAPLIIIWFGIGISMKVALSAFGTLLVALSQSYEGAAQVDQNAVRLMAILKASRFQLLHKAVFPSSISWVFQSLKLNINVALLGAFIGEFISSDQGLGHEMIRAGALYDIPGVLAAALCLVGLSLLLQIVIFGIERQKERFISVLSVPLEVRRRS